VTRRVPLLLAAGLVAVVAGCSGDKKTTSTTTVPTAQSLFAGGPAATGFADVRTAIRTLYTQHPEIGSFTYQDVSYTPATRDKVLTVCRVGGPTANARERETSRVFGCAPLIFFFYSFGTRKRVPESVDVARDLYGYAAAISGPFNPKPALTGLLRSWGVR
jgi:hypothetical protein